VIWNNAMVKHLSAGQHLGDGHKKIKFIFWSSIAVIAVITLFFLVFGLANPGAMPSLIQWLNEHHMHLTLMRLPLHALVYWQLPRFCRYINAGVLPEVIQRVRKSHVTLVVIYECLMSIETINILFG
jgi:hypothetical protein